MAESLPPRAAVRYRVRLAPRQHRLLVRLVIARPQAEQTLSLPVWIPGSYLVREFAGQLLRISAGQGGQPVAVAQTGKNCWQVRADPRRALRVDYEVHAHDPSVRAAWLDAQRGFFNGASVCLRAHGQQDAAHELTMHAPPDLPGWSLATALLPVRAGRNGFGRYRAFDYDELADNPVEMGVFWSGQFQARGVPHRLVVAGAPPSFDGPRLLADTRKICQAAIAFWHGARGRPPHGRYLFLLNALHEGYGGLEHRHGAALQCARKDLPRLGEAGPPSEGYAGLLGLISHEYFHLWNVKRLRPAELARYDYERENHTRLLWFFEGFTSYYDDLLLLRAGLIDAAAYFKLLATAINQVLQAPGRRVQSVAQASFEAWTKHYRPDANTPNATISYYTKGALVALCVDLTLRRQGRGTLDDVMRALWRRCNGGPMTEADLLAVLRAQSGRSWAREIAAWVHGTGELPLEKLLRAHGVQVLQEAAPLAQRLGLRVDERAGILVKTVLSGSAAEAAGMAPGDEWLGIELPSGGAWRLMKLDDLPLYAGPARRLTAVVARERRLLRLLLALPPGEATAWRLLPPAKAAGAPSWPAC
ncbi:MAG: peptidase M61 [Burkholderiaceae bacterium]|jgi:predicted metalloprotease with PDZ domain|nr:peptidase M61 [Burkholderiaceae bacterium]